jgi:hypothetical protein
MDTFEALAGVPVVVIVPALIEGAKQAGLPTRYAGLAAILVATCLIALADIAGGDTSGGAPARWFLFGLVHGLAGAGLYTQVKRLPLPAGESTNA